MSGNTSLSASLFSLMKDVSEALNFDGQERNEDAYKKYLECVLRTSTSLLKNVYADGGHVFVTKDLVRMVGLGKQCMDRVVAIVNEKLVSERAPKEKQTVQAPTSLHLSTGPAPPKLKYQATPTTPGMRDTTPVANKVPSCGTPGKPDQNVGPSSFGSSTSRKLTPMTIAARQNQQLLIALRKRQAQTKNKTASVSLGLTIQRKMAENLAIARAQEEALEKKMQERQKRLEEQAAKRFLAPLGLSDEELHQRQVYKRVLEFEQENDWMMDLRKKLEEAPADISIIGELITAILRCGAHPLTEELQNLLRTVIQKISLLVCGKLEYIDAIKVPLSTDIIEKSRSVAKTKSNLKTSQSESSLHSVIEEDIGSLKRSHDTTDHSDSLEGSSAVSVCSGICENKSFSEKEISSVGISPAEDGNGLTKVTEDIKSDMGKAILKGNELKSRLEDENRHLKDISRQLTQDYEQYNQENMDDLFDDDDDVDNDDYEDDDEGEKDVSISADNEHGDSSQEKDVKSVDDSTGNIEDTSEPKNEKEIEGSSHTNDSVITADEGVRDLKPKSYKRNPSFKNLESRIAELRNEDFYHHLKGITDDILTSIEKIQVLFMIAFEQLKSAEGRDQCNVLIEEYFFKPLWRDLLVLFRLVNEPKEVALAILMTENQSCTPEMFQVREMLCLRSDSSSGYPYQTAVGELVAVTHCENMLEKLDCLVRSSKQVMQCIDEFYRSTSTEASSLGADDLLPILSYIVVRSGLPQLVSECQAMERFIHEGYMFGEEGYCLTSFQTAINYLIAESLASRPQ